MVKIFSFCFLDILDLKSAIYNLQQHIVKYADGYKEVLWKLNYLQQSVDNLQSSRQLYDFDSSRQLYDFDSDLFLADDRQSPMAEVTGHAQFNSSEIKKSTPILSEDTEPPKPLFPAITGKNCLPSSEIKKSKLVSAGVVINKYAKMKTESKVGTLAVKLARQAYFGDEVMQKCTVQGIREFPGLPSAELCLLKKEIFSMFPQFWRNPSEFEAVWSTCVSCIGQACKRLRAKKN